MRCSVANRMKVKRGEDLPHARLTADDVRLIRQIHADKQEQIARLNETCSVQALAEKFEVHPRTIEKVIGFETWRHVK